MFRLLLLAMCAGAAFAATPGIAQTPKGAAAECLRLNALKIDWGDSAVAGPHRKLTLETCRKAYVEDASDPKIKIALARFVSDRTQSVPLLRAAVAQDDAEAMLALYNDFHSFDRNPNRPDIISRAEAEKALRRAAELGNRDAMARLMSMLARGGPIKRDPVAARHLAERLLANPQEGTSAASLQLSVANWLVQSDKPDERKRGIDMLEAMAKSGRGDMQANLAIAIRRDDPVRARNLLEQAMRGYPDYARVPLTDMLIKGEGGPKDESRAVSLLQHTPYDAQHAKYALGLLTLEGRLVRRDVNQAIKLMGPWSQWDVEARLKIVRALADNPEAKMEYSEHFLYAAVEAAELGEPGAADAVIALKLSRNAQFADKAGACALAAKVGTTVTECQGK